MLRDPGDPRSFPPDEQHEVLGLACHPLTELAAARTHWALRPLAEAAGTWGYLRRPVSKSTVGRWLKRAALKPYRVRRWLHSPDPEFRLKVRRVVRWYLRPPRRTHVVCVDEKTQVQILERLHPGAQRVRAGRRARKSTTGATACWRFWRASTSGRAACWRACDDDGVGASSSNFSRHSVAATPTAAWSSSWTTCRFTRHQRSARGSPLSRAVCGSSSFHSMPRG